MNGKQKIMLQLLYFFIFSFIITRITPTQAQIVDLSGDLLDQVQTIRNNMPGAGSEGFVKPTNEELDDWRNLITNLIDGRYTTADSLVHANFPFYQLFRFTDTGFNDQIYYLLRENFPVTKGWGTFIINPNFERQICIEIPHPIYDINTYSEGTNIFRRTGSRFLIMAGTHRCANAEISPCDGTFHGCGDDRYPVSDMAHFAASPFQVTHETIFEKNVQIYAFNIHGHGRDDCEDIFLSNGHKTQSKPILFNIKASLLASGGVSVAVAGDGTSSCPLVGSNNVQGRFTNNAPDPCTEAASATTGYFIHVEQTRRVRDSFSLYSKFINAINDNIGRVTSVNGKESVYGGNPPLTPNLFSIFPNPFFTASTISYELLERSRVSLKIYNLKGQVVRVLERNLFKEKGLYQMQWDGTDEYGKPLPSGIYFVEFSVGKSLNRARLTLLR